MALLPLPIVRLIMRPKFCLRLTHYELGPVTLNTHHFVQCYVSKLGETIVQLSTGERFEVRETPERVNELLGGVYT